MGLKQGHNKEKTMVGQADRQTGKQADRRTIGILLEGASVAPANTAYHNCSTALKENHQIRLHALLWTRHEGRSWYTAHRGRLWIAATAKVPSPEDIDMIENEYRAYYRGCTFDVLEYYMSQIIA